MGEPQVSVLVPTWNRAAFLRPAIESVLAQSFGDLEVIVIDDGSTDETPDVLAAVGDPRLRVLRLEHGGISRALNRGLAAARGELVARLDSDDLWLPDLLALETGVLESRPDVEVVYARAEEIDENGDRVDAAPRGRPGRYPGEPFRSMLVEDFICNIAMLAPRRCFLEVGGYDETLATSEDWHLWLRMAQRYRFAFLDRVVARYRRHGGNITSSRSPDFVGFVEGRTRVLDKIFAEPDLEPSHRRMRRESYASVHTWSGFVWLGNGRWAPALRAFGRAVASSDRRPETIARIGWALTTRFLERLPLGPRVVGAVRGAARRVIQKP